jgi:hypothetical protein
VLGTVIVIVELVCAPTVAATPFTVTVGVEVPNADPLITSVPPTHVGLEV